MNTPKLPNDFIQFVLDAEESPDLTLEFMETKDPDAVRDFFKKHKYTGIQPNRCEDIFKSKENWKELSKKHTGCWPCNHRQKGY